ncbi:MAG: type I-U CRISPR-associated protein Cas5/Cas6, partial [Rhodospirillales bacterium]|nr:type I-U CRISPR-associated protein Cas5/Cas6 [Acetobacter sp.]
MDTAILPAALASSATRLTDLVIEANFVSPRVMAASKTDRSEPEWPIHPSRLFSAMVAALHTIPEMDPAFADAEAAVEWMETLGPPEVHAAAADGSVRSLAYVPFNDVSVVKGKSLLLEACLPDSPRRKKGREFPGVSVPVPVIRYAWQVDPAELALRRTGLQIVLSRISYLGRSVNFVVMRLFEVAPDLLPHAAALEHWIPSLHGPLRMRTFGPGRLEHLRMLYQAGKPVDHGPASVYRCAETETAPAGVAPGPWSRVWTTFALS